MNPINKQQVQHALSTDSLSQNDRDLLQEWFEGDQGVRDELDDDVKAILGTIATIAPANAPQQSSLNFSEEELRVLLPRLSDEQQNAYNTWTTARALTTKKKLEAVFLPALKNARNHVRLEQRKNTLSSAFHNGTLVFETLSEEEITILLGVLPNEDGQVLLARANLAQQRLTALYQGLATFSQLRGNKTCFGLLRFRQDGEILSSLRRGVDPLSVPPQRAFHRFLWRLRGWDV
jgi:hypothetical protein